MKRKYEIFTKKELIQFLNKYEGMFHMKDSPFNIMIDKKMDVVMAKISQTNKKSRSLTEDSQGTISYDTLLEIRKNHEQWNKLNKEYDRLSKLRFGE